MLCAAAHRSERSNLRPAVTPRMQQKLSQTAVAQLLGSAQKNITDQQPGHLCWVSVLTTLSNRSHSADHNLQTARVKKDELAQHAVP